MSESRAIQRFDAKAPAGAIMTPQGPAIIQVIDMPTGGLSSGYGTPAPIKPGGINILGAVLRRWWLVAICTVIIGAAGWYAGNHLIRPSYESVAIVSYYDMRPNAQGESLGTGALQQMVGSAIDLITSPDMTLLAVQDPEMQRTFPGILQGKNLANPVDKQAIVLAFNNVVTAEDVKGKDFVNITAHRGNPNESFVLANAYARAMCEFCKRAITGADEVTRKALTDQITTDQSEREKLSTARDTLVAESRYDLKVKQYEAMLTEILRIRSAQNKAEVDLAAAEAKYNQLNNNGQRRPDEELKRIELIDTAKQKDGILQMLMQQKLTTVTHFNELRSTLKPEHPDYMQAQRQLEDVDRQIAARDAEISAIIEQQIKQNFLWTNAANVDQAKAAMQDAKSQLALCEQQLAKMDTEAARLSLVKMKIDEFNRQIDYVTKRRDDNQNMLNQQIANNNTMNMSTMIQVMTPARLPEKPMEDKRVKVQMAGVAGGLFLGVLLSLLIDRFDKRLRNPRDIEPLLGAPLLGSIPRIQDLKRAKGEQARNLIAEEFRIIRTQVLFGNPHLRHKTIAVTSPSPGDGKTSLAVNLAISMAKAGRRVLLIDADLRKPDVHRIFNVPEGPGFAELIQNTTDLNHSIRKTDIENLEVLPAGTPTARPSELLSRPEMSAVLAALCDVYDHVILDTAPLLPVSDTHVLVGHVDGTICSFDAEVDRDTVAMCHDILRRSRATIIGSVMNQVKYKHSGSYQRGKSAYDSYYNSPRTRGAALAKAAIDPSPTEKN